MSGIVKCQLALQLQCFAQPTEQEELEADQEVAKVTGQAGSQASDLEEPSPRSTDGQDLIHPNDVLKALRSFVEDNKEPPKYVSYSLFQYYKWYLHFQFE